MPVDPERLRRCYETARDVLLAERNDAGHWEGELSTSALSTATAVMALELVRRAGGRKPPEDTTDSHPTRGADALPLASLIEGGIQWLAAHQNDDGGWGDTTKSVSNISTTMLCRASLYATGNDDTHADVVQRAVRYIDDAGGVDAVLIRYGKDRTFSIPILTHCALAGLVDWKDVLPLPFYLACLPHRFYKTVRLPVVSYALPALIAIGQVGYHFRKPWNPISRFVKWLAIPPSLRKLEQIQPANGGFLEATPLTSFVTMSLAGMGRADHPVARKGVQFLVDSVRPDGSWPIDTNLATWVTTLSVNALGDDLPEDARPAIRDWLLNQQYQEVHPYTNADPGGWAWTDLPGGVPDADDTPGAMLALMALGQGSGVRGQESGIPTQADGLPSRPNAGDVDAGSDTAPRTRYSVPSTQYPVRHTESLKRAVKWLLDVQNRDGGFPTFCRGWGTLPFDRSSPDITAHCIRALFRFLTANNLSASPSDQGSGLITKLRNDVVDDLAYFSATDADEADGIRIENSLSRVIATGFRFLDRNQLPDGSWLPLWFGNQHAPDDVNPLYGTAKVLAAYRDCDRFGTSAAQRGLEWLRANQNEDGGWGGMKGIASSVEETALAVEILLSDDPQAEIVQRGLHWLCDRVESGSRTVQSPVESGKRHASPLTTHYSPLTDDHSRLFLEPSPIGFYFARLWYFERLYPLIFTVAALRRALQTAGDSQARSRHVHQTPT